MKKKFKFTARVISVILSVLLFAGYTSASDVCGGHCRIKEHQRERNVVEFGNRRNG